ncbi:hypothetical protein QNO07_08615 [Streptomyces sp. 549]|uniref:hypothetical protein n=1 Tax=Streptomyces sp. 549 TaxID=3049076 RepID=UPI0024C3FD03|nr:hypothetical protein [Streptomyces sp. 549]MDK1473478.1 hypothetical protein [Streptomyces sp. 549]
MQLPVHALASTALIEVIRISALPDEPGDPYPGEVVAHWTGDAVTRALALIQTLPAVAQHRCGFRPGWGIRAYQDALERVLLEAAFCFSCHEVRTHGTAVPAELAKQFFDADSPPGRALLALFRDAPPRLPTR